MNYTTILSIGNAVSCNECIYNCFFGTGNILEQPCALAYMLVVFFGYMVNILGELQSQVQSKPAA